MHSFPAHGFRENSDLVTMFSQTLKNTELSSNTVITYEIWDSHSSVQEGFIFAYLVL